MSDLYTPERIDTQSVTFALRMERCKKCDRDMVGGFNDSVEGKTE